MEGGSAVEGSGLPPLRSHPFKGGFSVACGLRDAIDYLHTLAFGDDELAYLGTLTGNDGKPLFEPGFLDYLRAMDWNCDVDGIAEGTVVFPHEPLLRIQGPLIQCQLVETAVREKGGAWKHKIKLSEQVAKISTPGLQQVRRFRRNGAFLGDMIYDLDGPAETGAVIVDRTDLTRRKHISDDADYEDLLVPIFRSGRLVYEQPPIANIRGRAQMQLSGFHEGHKRFLNPHEYPVGLSPALHDLRTRLVFAARESAATAKTTHAP